MWHLALIAAGAFLALVGWGTACLDAVRRWRGEAPDVPASAIGLAGVLALGGPLVLSGAFGPVAVGTLYFAGLGYAGFGLVRRLRRPAVPEWTTVLGVAVGVLVVLPLFVTGLHRVGFNTMDDYYSYLVTPNRLIALGHVVLDPFNYRGNTSMLGGATFLMAAAGLFVGQGSVALVDSSVGPVLLCAALLWLFRRTGAAVALPLALPVIFYVTFPMYPNTANVTPYFMVMALLLVLAGMYLDERSHGSPAHMLTAGLLVAGLAALKNTALPVVALLVTATYVAWGLRERAPRRAVTGLCAVGALSLAVTAVWAWPYLTSDTVLVRLGYGDGPTQMHLADLWHRAFGRWVRWLVAFLVAGAAACALAWRRAELPGLLGLLLAVPLGHMAIILATGGAAPNRYGFPFIAVAYVVVGAYLIGRLAADRRWRAGAIAAVVAGLFVFRPATIAPAEVLALYGNAYRNLPADMRVATPTPFPNPAYRDWVRRVQGLTPEGAPLLVWTDHPFLFDFRRNEVYVMDFPCMASLPPGMPCDGDTDALVAYLRGVGIHHVIYGYGNEAGYPRARARKRAGGRRHFHAITVGRIVYMHDRMDEMMARSERVVRADKLAVIDLDAYVPMPADSRGSGNPSGGAGSPGPAPERPGRPPTPPNPLS